LDSLVRRSGAIEVLAITGEGEADQSRPPPPPRPGSCREYAAAVLIVWVPTALGMLLRKLGASVPTIDAAMLYLLAMVVAATRYRQGAAVTAALVGIASFDFFFVHPFYTFSVSDGKCCQAHTSRHAGRDRGGSESRRGPGLGSWSGPGTAPGEEERVFEKFYRGSSA